MSFDWPGVHRITRCAIINTPVTAAKVCQSYMPIGSKATVAECKLRWIRQDVIVSIPRLPCHISERLLQCKLGDLISISKTKDFVALEETVWCSAHIYTHRISRHLVFSFIHNFLLTPTLDLGHQANISSRARHRSASRPQHPESTTLVDLTGQDPSKAFRLTVASYWLPRSICYLHNVYISKCTYTHLRTLTLQ